MKHVVIIGNGISGITAARQIRKRSNYRISVISSETDHFFSRTALMYVFMGHLKYEHTKPYEDEFWKKNRIDLVRDYVNAVDFDNKTLKLDEKGAFSYDFLILAVGSKPNMFGWPGQDLEGVQGLYSFQDLESLERNTHSYGASARERTVKRAVIVGGGLIGVEFAEMMHSRNIPVTFLVRENRFWGNVLPVREGALVARQLIDHHVDLRLETELKEVLSDEKGRCRAVITNHGEEIPCQIVGLTAGVSANVNFLRDGELAVERGIVVDNYLQTNIPDVYAIGDCAQLSSPQPGRRPIEQVWYTGRMMGETVARTITDKPLEYNPGFWFNSAKFFDIEYQTYGTVLGDLREGETDFYWEHENGKICLHLVWEKDSRKFVGLNVFGIRMRHPVFDRWLHESRTTDFVIEHLLDANFDPEFYKLHEPDIVSAFNKQEGCNISLKKRDFKRIFNLTKA